MRVFNVAVGRMRLFVRSGLCHRALASWAKARPSSGKTTGIRKLWRDFFANTSQWWDQRLDKIQPRSPDFEHKRTGELLWLSDSRNPSWVPKKLAAMRPGALQSHTSAWNQKLKSYAKSGQHIKTLEVFHQMQKKGVRSDRWTFLPVLNSCAVLGALQEGKRVHKQVLEAGCESNTYIANCLVHMYAKCGSIEDARRVFDKLPTRNVITWNAMIGGYVKSGQALKAMELFQQMQQEGMEPNPVTFVGVVNACASLATLHQGRRVHQQIIRRGCENNLFVGSSLVNMYAKCGSIEDAGRVFNKLSTRDVITWNVMILGYVKSGEGQKAMELFEKMQQDGVEPDSVTFVGMLNACASLAALEEGRCVHKQIIRRRCESNVFVGNGLVDMYAKCGSIEDAHRVFNNMPTRDVVTWNSMIGGYAMHGDAEKAMQLFGRMAREGVEINRITLTNLLSACSHGGLVKEGLTYFKSMSPHFNILPTVGHYTCMIDLLGRAGRLKEAEELTKMMPFGADVPPWRSLLGACRVHGDTEIAQRAAKRCLELAPENASGYVLLSNIYAAAGQWDRSAAVQRERLEKKVGKS